MRTLADTRWKQQDIPRPRTSRLGNFPTPEQPALDSPVQTLDIPATYVTRRVSVEHMQPNCDEARPDMPAATFIFRRCCGGNTDAPTPGAKRKHLEKKNG